MDTTARVENDAKRDLKQVSRTIDQGVDSAIETLATSFKAVVADAEELLTATANLSGESLKVAREKFREKVATAKTKLADAQSAASEKAEQAGAVTEKYVTENPWKALAIVGSVGMIIGMLIHRR